MTAEKIVLFLEALHAKNIKIKQNGWVEASCVLAKWTHNKGKDSNPSFGIVINDYGESHYQCFSCHGGSLETLIQTLELYTSQDGTISEYNFKFCHELLADSEGLLPLPEYGSPATKEQQFEEWPLYWLDSFKPIHFFSEAEHYVTSRGLTQEMIQKHNLRYDTQRKMIVAPYFNVFGKFAGARGRSILEGVTGHYKHYDYSWNGKNNSKLVWYNEEVLNLPGPVIIVEGQFDVWNTEKVHAKTIGNLKAKPTWEKMQLLGSCPLIIQIPDNDKTGHESVQRYYEYSKKIGVAFRVLYLDDGAKDPADCHPDYLRDKIQGLLY